jgi:hypothetical protein
MSSKFLAAGVAEFAHEVDGSCLGHVAQFDEAFRPAADKYP